MTCPFSELYLSACPSSDHPVPAPAFSAPCWRGEGPGVSAYPTVVTIPIYTGAQFSPGLIVEIFLTLRSTSFPPTWSWTSAPLLAREGQNLSEDLQQHKGGFSWYPGNALSQHRNRARKWFWPNLSQTMFTTSLTDPSSCNWTVIW